MPILRTRTDDCAVVHTVGGTVRLSCLCAAVLLASCDGGDQLPNDATLEISPREKSFTVTETIGEGGVCQFDPSLFADVPLVLTFAKRGGLAVGRCQGERLCGFCRQYVRPVSTSGPVPGTETGTA